MSKGSRSLSRRFAVEILYQRMMREVDLPAVLKQYAAKKRVDVAYLQDVINGIVAHEAEILDLIGKSLTERTVDELDAVETSILKIGIYELLYRYDIPYRVVIDESINLSKIFGGQDSHRLVNSVLDAVAKQARKLECDDSSSS